MANHNKNGNRINWNRSWYKIGFNFYNKSSLQRTNYPSARQDESAKVRHAYTTSCSNNIEPRTVMSKLLANPDSQSDTQEAIQSERAKGTPLIQTQSTLIHIGDPLRYGRWTHPYSKENPSPCMIKITLTNVLDPIYVHTLPLQR